MATHQDKFRPDIEGLRAVAVGLVVLAHAGVPGIEGGYIGVDVFFVLSGFLITGILIRERQTTGKTSMAGFYARRARRILPAACLVLVVTVLASYEWLGFLRGDTIAEDGKWAALFAANLRFASEGTQYLNILAPPSPLQHYWSLAVEEQFYLVWPMVFLVVARVAPRVSLASKLAAVLCLTIAASFAWSVIQTRTDVTWAFFSPLTRAWELALGALLAVAAPSLKRLPARWGPWMGWGGLAAVVFGAMWFDNATAFPGYAAALPVFATATVVAAGSIAPQSRAGAVRLLGLPPFQVLGKWSYSLYLWHWPVLVIAEQRAGHELSLVQNLGLVVAAVVLAAATHYLVENPVRYAKPLAQRSWQSVAVGACLVFAAYGVCMWQVRDTAGPPAIARAEVILPSSPSYLANPQTTARRFAEDLPDLVAAAQQMQALPRNLKPSLEHARWDFAWIADWAEGCVGDEAEVVAKECVFGDPEGTRTVVVLGDSHAAMWLTGFDAVGKRQNWKIVLVSKAGCPAASLSITRHLSGPTDLWRPYVECPPWLADAVSRINALQPDVVVLASCAGCEFMVDASRNRLSEDAWADGLRKTLANLGPSGATQVVLGDVPRLPGALDCLALRANVHSCSKPVEAATAETFRDLERRVAVEASAAFIDVVPWFCGAICTPVIGDYVVYTNDYHLSATYAGFLSEALEAALIPMVEE